MHEQISDVFVEETMQKFMEVCAMSSEKNALKLEYTNGKKIIVR